MQTPQSIMTLAGFDGESFNISSSNGNSLRGACPNCGGNRRLLVFIDKPTPNWNHQCDLCGYKSSRLDRLPTEYYGLMLGNQQVEVEEVTDKISALTESYLWLKYHQNLTEEIRAWYRDRGIPDLWQDKWLLGYTPRRSYLHDQQTLYSPAYTIPKTNYEFQIVNIDYRLVDFPDDAGKYRSESGLPPAVFIANPEIREGNRLFVVEGAFKAMNLYLFLEDNDWHSQVIGLPSVSSKLFLEHVTRFETCYVMLDPDSVKITRAVAKQIGYKGRPIYMPAKIDDAILAGLSWTTFKNIMDNSDI